MDQIIATISTNVDGRVSITVRFLADDRLLKYELDRVDHDHRIQADDVPAIRRALRREVESWLF